MHIHIAGSVIGASFLNRLGNFAMITDGIAVPLNILRDGNILGYGRIEHIGEIAENLVAASLSYQTMKEG